MIHSRKRVGLAAVTAAASMATVFALPSTAHALDLPNPVRNVIAQGGEGTVTVRWDAPLVGTGGNFPDEYVVWIRKADNSVVDQITVPASVFEATSSGLAAGTYYATIFASNTAGRSAAVNTNTVAVTGAAALPVNVNAYRPYANWDALITQEYGFWTGCEPTADNVGGRLPRDDERLFWRQYLTAPLDTRVRTWVEHIDGDPEAEPPVADDYRVHNEPITAESQYYWDTVASLESARWAELTNGASWDPAGGVVTGANYKTSTAYKTLFDKEFARLTTIPSTGGFAPADDPAVNIVTPGNGNNLIEDAEKEWATPLAEAFALDAVNLTTEFASQVSTYAQSNAATATFFARRLNFVRSLAEEAEQTDGPAFRLYTAYFRRVPDAKGLCFWTNSLRSGWSLLDVSEFFVQSDEFLETYGEYGTNASEDGIDAAEFVALVYRNVLKRDADGAGAAFWTRQLQEERYSPAEMLIGFSESAEFKNRMENEVGTGLAFIHLLGRMPTEQEYTRASYEGWDFLTTYNGLHYNDPALDALHRVVETSGLYQAIIDSERRTTNVPFANGEYSKRSGLPVPASAVADDVDDADDAEDAG